MTLSEHIKKCQELLAVGGDIGIRIFDSSLGVVHAKATANDFHHIVNKKKGTTRLVFIEADIP